MYILFFVIGILILLAVWWTILPYSLLRLFSLLLRNSFYRFELIGKNYIPKKGGALLIVNHVSVFDGLILMGLSRRRIHFMVKSDVYRMKKLNWLFKKGKIIEVPNANQPKKMQEFLDKIKQLLKNGELVCVYPEGGISLNGVSKNFKNGIQAMLPDDIDIPLIPIRIGLMRGDYFAFYNNRITKIAGRKFPQPISVVMRESISKNLTAFEFRQVISEMGADAEMVPAKGEKTIHYNFLCKAKRKGWQKIYHDYNAKNGVSNFQMLLRSLIVSKVIRSLKNYKESDLIGILLPNCTNFVMVIFGVLFSDKTPAILNYSSGEATINKIIDKSNIKIILTSKKFLDKLNIQVTPNMILLEDLAKNISKQIKVTTLLNVILLPRYFLMKKYAKKNMYDLNNPLTIIYSSGSTGMPKGVVLTHRNLNSNIYSFGRVINWQKNDIILGSLPIFHAYGFNVCFAFPAVEGVKVVYVLSPIDGTAVCDCIDKHKCTMMMATPTFLQTYMRKYKEGQFKTLRLVITGAEKLRNDISKKFNQITNLEVVEGFGCTEISPIVSINLAHSLRDLGRKYGKKNSIGVALPGLHVKIVDPDTYEELDENQSGLMLVKGGSVMKGYLNDEENTNSVMHNEYYKTGDIAKMDSEGYLYITGRLSRMSKIAGEMVPHELVELSINEEVKSEERVVAVSSCSDSTRGERLIVFYSVDNLEPNLIVKALRDKNLPNLWIPKANDFIKIDKIPLLGSGKIDLQKIKQLAEELN